MTISYLMKYLWRKKWLILIPAILTFILAWFLTRKLEPEYSSVAELSTGYMEANPFDQGKNANINALFSNVIVTLQSPQILDQVSYRLIENALVSQHPFKNSVDKSDLQKILARFSINQSDFANVLMRKIDSATVLNLAADDDRMVREVANLYGYAPINILNMVQVNRIEGTSFIRIIATSEDPKLSAFMANEICNQFLKLYQSRQGESSMVSLDMLRSIMESKRRALDDKQNMLQGMDSRAEADPNQFLATLRIQLLTQQNNLISVQTSLKSINDQIKNANSSGAGSATNEEIIALRNNIDQLYSRYVNGGSTDQNLLMQIDNLRNRLQQKMTETGAGTEKIPVSELERQKTDFENQISIAQQTISSLEDRIRLLENTARTSAAQQGLVGRFQSEVEIARQEFIRANDNYNEALNREKFPGNQFNQILVASPALSANPSIKNKIIVFAGIGIFFALIFLFLFFEFVDPSVKTPANLTNRMPFSFLGSIKRLSRKKAKKLDRTFDTSIQKILDCPEIEDAMKQIRYDVEQSGRRIFLVTSHQSGSGKTTILRGLAESLSINNKKVLIIDSNFHNNTLSNTFGANGLLDEINLPSENPDAGKKVIAEQIQYLKEDKVGFIGCSSGDYTPEEILPKNNILDFLKSQLLGFDYVLIDAAGVDKGPDSKELLSYADGVILVYAADQSWTDGDLQLAQFLKDREVFVVGAVLNKVNIGVD